MNDMLKTKVGDWVTLRFLDNPAANISTLIDGRVTGIIDGGIKVSEGNIMQSIPISFNQIIAFYNSSLHKTKEEGVCMNTEKFNEIINEQIKRSTDVLVKKAEEYATSGPNEDRLHNFRVAAAVEGISPRQALAGMMAKHTVSVYDMCGSNEDYPMDLWNEKITDSINYLLLLKALVIDEKTKENTQ